MCSRMLEAKSYCRNSHSSPDSHRRERLPGARRHSGERGLPVPTLMSVASPDVYGRRRRGVASPDVYGRRRREVRPTAGGGRLAVAGA